MLQNYPDQKLTEVQVFRSIMARPPGPALKQRCSTAPQASEELLHNSRDGREGIEDEVEGEIELISAKDIKQRLHECLDNATSTTADSQFAYYAGLKYAPNPALRIRGYGSIGFPLSDQDIQKIITASRSIPRSETARRHKQVPVGH